MEPIGLHAPPALAARDAGSLARSLGWPFPREVPGEAFRGRAQDASRTRLLRTLRPVRDMASRPDCQGLRSPPSARPPNRTLAVFESAALTFFAGAIACG